MATRTVTANDYMKPYATNLNRTGAGGVEGASQTFGLGTPLIYASTSGHENRLIVTGSDATSGIVGVASIAATGVTDTPMTYWIADNGNQFVAPVQSTGTLAYTQVGLQCGIVPDTTVSPTIYRVDYSDTTNKSVEITALVDPVGTVNGLVAFQFISAARIPFQG
ncbi:MAG TPA: hypothetical protein VNH18_32625 [Bryobacteraceae bacterium]|nr:hypothetical protein [Bryobacteraceae bacterium]